MIPVAPPVDPEEVETTQRALEVMVMWGELSVVYVAHLSPPRAFWVGEGEGDFLIGRESLGMDRLPITLEGPTGTALVVPAGATAELLVDGQVLDMAATEMAPCSELPGAMQYPLPPDSSARLHYRGFTFVVKSGCAGKAVGVGGTSGLDLRRYKWVLTSVMAHLLVLGLFYLLPPKAASLSLQEGDPQHRLIRFMHTQELEEPPELTALEPDKEAGDGKPGQRHEGDEGKMGDRKAPKTKNKRGVPGNSPEVVLSRKELKGRADNAGIIGVLKQQFLTMSPASPFGAERAQGSDAVAAIGAIMGDQVGSGFGWGGVGSIGTGRGGGGRARGTIGVGDVGTKGGYGGASSGTPGILGPHKGNGPSRIRPGRPEIAGSLSKEVIRRVIRRHINEVRHCYEQELVSQPDLEGRVAVKFIITASGEVHTAAPTHSTLGNARAEQCIARAVRRWVFPQPSNGGVVVVTYPFRFQQTGT